MMFHELIREMSQKGMTREAIAELFDLQPQDIVEITKLDQSAP